MGYDVTGVAVVKEYGNKTGKVLPHYCRTNRGWEDSWSLKDVRKWHGNFNLKDVMGYRKSVTKDSASGLMAGLANNQMKRTLKMMVQNLTLMSEGHISIATRDKNIFFNDTSHFEVFRFSTIKSKYVFYDMLSFMVKSKISYMGPLVDMNYAIADWSSKLESGQFNFQFSFTWR